MRAGWRGRHHIALVLDGARAQQHFPVGAPGGGGEGGRQHDQVDRAHRAEQLRKAQVVAHREADAGKRQIDHRRLRRAGFDGRGLVVHLVAPAEAEQVNLVVARGALAFGAEEHEAVVDLVGGIALQRHGAAKQPDAVATRAVGKESLHRPVAGALANAHLGLLVTAEQAEILGQRDEPGTFGGGPRDHGLGHGEVLFDILARQHLHRRKTERHRRGLLGFRAHRTLLLSLIVICWTPETETRRRATVHPRRARHSRGSPGVRSSFPGWHSES